MTRPTTTAQIEADIDGAESPMLDAVTVDSIGVPHGFFTRRGGVSNGPFASLNCSLSSPDDPDAVRQNRSRVAAALGVAVDRLVGLTQVHGATVATVAEPWSTGRGPQADAMVTERPDIVLGIVTADCAPVLFVDAGRNIVGAAHAGWRGAVAGVLEATVGAMAALGADPAAITAAVGPCIAQASYEVAADLRDTVLAGAFVNAGFFGPGRRADRWQFDLPGYCAARLRACGVSRIMLTGHDTVADEERFFSHRRRTLRNSGPIGHQISVIRPA